MSWPGPPPHPPWQERLRLASRRGLDWIFPRRCPGCERVLSSAPDIRLPPPSTDARANKAALDTALTSRLCAACRDHLPWITETRCQRCGEPYPGALDHPLHCWNCEDRPFAFEFATAGFRSEGLVRDLIHTFKYERHLEQRSLLALMLSAALQDPRLLREDLAQWLLVPVPLHFSRRIVREYNQSWELCRGLTRLTGIPSAQVLRRTRRTTSQASLDRRQRLTNLRGAFSLRRQADVRDRRILLVDDVLTTGATTHECARVLRRSGGAEKVVVITVGRG
ncbi:MAG: ComF family protein [Verrucomicrobiales bacterium]|nr:ComF family protein [Verrucomicrobiales bacterium]